MTKFSVPAVVLPAMLFVSVAQAEDVDVAGGFDRFASACGQLIEDPEGYISNLPRPGPKGERVVSVSPDGKATSIYVRDANLYEEAEVHEIGDALLIQCSVIVELDDLEGEELANAFRDVVAAKPEIEMTGGQTPQDYVEEGSYVFTLEPFFLFALRGLWPDPNLMSTVDIIESELQMDVQLTVQR